MEVNEKKSKTIIDAEKNVLSRQGEKGSALKESERVLSTQERLFLNDLKERGLEVMEKNHLDIWFVQTNGGQGGLQMKDIHDLYALEQAHNDKVRSGEKEDVDREVRFKNYDFGDLKYFLQQTYQKPGMIREIPEIIVVHARTGEYPGSWTGISKIIQESIDKCMEKLNYYWEDEAIRILGENLCCQLANKFEYEKVELSLENLLEYGLMDLEMIQRECQKEFFEKYIFSGDQKYLEEFFSDKVLFEIYENMCKIPEESISRFLYDYEFSNDREEDLKSDFYQQFKGVIDHDAKKREWEKAFKKEKKNGQIDQDDDSQYDPAYEEMRLAMENYQEYRESIAQTSRLLNFEGIKEEMRQIYVLKIKKVLDEHSSNYINQHEMFEAEKKLLKPILIFVGEDPVQRELMRDQGADVVLEKLSPDEIQDLFELVGKMKSSASSLMPGKLRKIKAEFYKSVEEKLDARSEITAETEKEIEILHEIFQKNGNVKKVLDIACGNGRIDIPLLEKGYEVTGVDANEKFLQSALRKVLEKNLSGAQFKSGDVIDFSGVVEPGSQDAVIYTWHSILEAFGVGNLLHTLGNSWSSLRPGGVLVFDQPTRENPHMEDGWYGNDPDGEHQYLSYIMEEDEIKFILKTAGFENVEILKWKTRPSEEYPDGMHKFTVSARKPLVDEQARENTKMYREIIKNGFEKWMKE